MDFQEKLMRINKNCVFHLDSHTQVSNAVNTNEKDAVIAFSYSGQIREVNCAVKRARENNTFCLAVTRPSKVGLSKLVNEICWIPNIKSESDDIRLGALLSRFAESFIADLLFIGIAQNDIEAVKNCLFETKKLISALLVFTFAF
jgi:DNA-binding MurR/RpiR family transcriptional regulator